MDFKVSAIVNTFNRHSTIRECIESLQNQKNLLEIIVVDDGSFPPLFEVPGVNKSVRLPKTVGVSRGRNIGALASSDEATHLFFTDDDIVLEDACLKILCEEQIWSNMNVAAVGGSVPNMSEPEKVSKVFRYNCHPMTIDENGRVTDLSEFWVEEDKWWSADHIRGGNQLLRRDIFFEIGGFRWEYGIGGFREETDFCLELKRHGYRIWFNPVARALHFRVPYGGLRVHPEVEKQYDNIFRTRWAPLHYMGCHIDYPKNLISLIGERK